jgi:hypothetical protein
MRTVTKNSNMSSKMRTSTTRTFTNGFPTQTYLNRDKKKLLGVSFEKEGYIMFAIAPKC